MQAWISAHLDLFNLLLWPLISMLVTGAYRWLTGPDFAAKYPRIEAIVVILEKLAPSLDGMLAELRALLTGQPSAASSFMAMKRRTDNGQSTSSKLPPLGPGLASIALLCIGSAVAVAPPILLTGCKGSMPVVIQDVSTGCEVVTFLLPSPLATSACVTLEDVLALIAECESALSAGRAATYTYKGATYQVPAERVADQLSSLYLAAIKLRAAKANAAAGGGAIGGAK
jgi:hypothetical protein